MNNALASVIVAVIVGILLPFLVATIRMNVRWARIEDNVTALKEDLTEMKDDMRIQLDIVVKDKDRAHLELAATLREDRKMMVDQLTRDRESNDKRLRWLEEHLWQPKGR